MTAMSISFTLLNVWMSVFVVVNGNYLSPVRLADQFSRVIYNSGNDNMLFYVTRFSEWGKKMWKSDGPPK